MPRIIRDETAPPSGSSSCMRIWFLNSIRSRRLTLLTFSSVTLINSLPTLTVVPTSAGARLIANCKFETVPPAPPVTKEMANTVLSSSRNSGLNRSWLANSESPRTFLKYARCKDSSIVSCAPSRKPPMAKAPTEKSSTTLVRLRMKAGLFANLPKPPTMDSETPVISPANAPSDRERLRASSSSIPLPV